jgi:hypothetical protein
MGAGSIARRNRKELDPKSRAHARKSTTLPRQPELDTNEKLHLASDLAGPQAALQKKRSKEIRHEVQQCYFGKTPPLVVAAGLDLAPRKKEG